MIRSVRPLRVEGDVAFIPLTQGYEAVIDAADAPAVAPWNWRVHKGKKTVYAARSVRQGRKIAVVLLHRQLLGAAPGEIADHHDENGLNNRRKNLRRTGVEGNSQNRSLRRDNTSGAKGVRQDPRTGRWIASIRANKKRFYLGSFADRDSAKAAYDRAAQEKHGAFFNPGNTADASESS